MAASPEENNKSEKIMEKTWKIIPEDKNPSGCHEPNSQEKVG